MSKSDNSLYVRSNSSLIFIILYVDDLVIGGEHLVNINKVKSLLSRKFEMTDMKELHYFLGIVMLLNAYRNHALNPIMLLNTNRHHAIIIGNPNPKTINTILARPTADHPWRRSQRRMHDDNVNAKCARMAMIMWEKAGQKWKDKWEGGIGYRNIK